jgi:hypothetical protein
MPLRHDMDQQPIFTDNVSVTGDGSQQHPLSANRTQIISADKKMTVDVGVTHVDQITIENTESAGTTGILIETGASNPGGIEIIDNGSGGIEILSGTGVQVGGVGGATIEAGAESIELQAGVGITMNGSLGFFGTSPVTQPTVTGSKGGNAALASLCTALADLGLIVNNTT